MSRFVLDTSAYSHFRRGHPAVVELVARASWIGLPAIVLGELRLGFLLGRDPDGNERRLRDFLGESVVEVQVVDEPASGTFAAIMMALRRAGRPVPTNDAWIAALAVRDGATLLTYDEDFRSIEALSCLILSQPT